MLYNYTMELITSNESAELLGVSCRRVNDLARDGYIRAKVVRGINMFDPNDVMQLKEIRDKGVTLVEAVTKATRAEMKASRVERRQDQILNVIGADIPAVDLTPEAVVALHTKVEDALTSSTLPSLEEILGWARTFQSLGEEYFHVVSEQYLTEEPWRPYIDLGNKLHREMPVKQLKTDIELHLAYNLLHMAKRNMRQMMFFYVCTTSGKRLAQQLFPESHGDVHQDIMAMVAAIVDTQH